ncbi:hypothetical protein EDB87DRAFT_1796504 [Lactarius vividus]|nr:hypothetical protein EDB87DRAFT_1796504 [Lactarius vividus]
MSMPPVPPDIAEITAPLILGVLWNWALYGVLVVQTYVYSYNFQGDRTLLKLLVYSLFLVETTQTALTGADLYYWFASGFGNMYHLTSPHLFEFDVPIVGSIVSLTVQLFFVYRIWILSGRSSWFLCLLICLCSIVGAVAAFYSGVHLYLHKLERLRASDVPLLVGPSCLQAIYITTRLQIWTSGNAMADLLIACSILFFLGRRRKEGSSHFSNHALSRIVRLTIETNVLTSTVGVVALLMVVIFPYKPWFSCPLAILGKLYSNTLLVSLNNRISIREGRGAVVRSPPLTLALTANSQPESGSEIVNIEFEKPFTASSEDCTGHTSKVIDTCITRDQVVAV